MELREPENVGMAWGSGGSFRGWRAGKLTGLRELGELEEPAGLREQAPAVGAEKGLRS